MDFLSLLKDQKIIILDGATGTQLAQRGAAPGGGANLSAPDVVAAVHCAYIEAGSHAVIANTFCLNRIYMDANKINAGVDEINRAGVDIARRAAGDNIAVLGDIGPTGKMLKPVGDCTEEQFIESFAEQARALAAAGADAFIIETMMDKNEAVCAVRACKQVSSLPVIASMTFATTRDGGRTTMGHKASDCAAALTETGADVLATNCGDLDPREVAIIVASYRSASALPILVEPNAGKPRLDDNNCAVYDMAPEDFAQGVATCMDAGATLIGGCCGTTPDHIRALARLAE